MSDTINYENFDIDIEVVDPAEGTYKVKVLYSPEGATQNPTIRTIPRNSIDELLIDVRGLVAELQDMEELGKELFEFLFPEAVKDLFDRSLTAVGTQGGLRIRLRWSLSDHKLSLIPWEYCYDASSSARGFLNLNPKTQIVRYSNVNRAPGSLALPTPIKLLIITSSPSNTPPLDLDQEVKGLKDLLQSLEAQGTLEIDEINKATRESLGQKLIDFQPHILHFAGHGGFIQEGKRKGEGAFLFHHPEYSDDHPDQAKTGQADYASAEDISILLKGLTQNSIRFVLLNACQTAASFQGEQPIQPGLLGLAQQLVSVGFPAVLGMQFAIPNHLAVDFMKLFYEALLRGETLENALGQTRVFLYQRDKNSWAIPTLFMRSDDGRLFESQSLAPESELPSAETVRRAIMQLNYSQPPLKVNEIRYKSQMAGAVVISGEQRAGSNWLLHRLTSILPRETGRLLVDVTLNRNARGDDDATWLWEQLANEIGVPGSSQADIITETHAILDEQNVLVVVRKATKWAKDYPERLLKNFWEPLVAKLPKSRIKVGHWLILIIVDEKVIAKTDEKGHLKLYTRVIDRDILDHPHWTPRDPIVLGPLEEKFSAQDIKSWTAVPETNQLEAVQELLKEPEIFIEEYTDMYCMDAIEELCELCGVEWHEVEQQWLGKL